jgi:hypothetical protein
LALGFHYQTTRVSRFLATELSDSRNKLTLLENWVYHQLVVTAQLASSGERAQKAREPTRSEPLTRSGASMARFFLKKKKKKRKNNSTHDQTTLITSNKNRVHLYYSCLAKTRMAWQGKHLNQSRKRKRKQAIQTIKVYCTSQDQAVSHLAQEHVHPDLRLANGVQGAALAAN